MEKTRIDDICGVCEEIEYKHVFNLVNITTAMFRIAKFRLNNQSMDRVEIIWVQILEPLAIEKTKLYVGDQGSSLLNVSDLIPDIPTTTAKLAWALAELHMIVRYELVEFLKEQCKLYASCFSATNFASIFWAFAKLKIDSGEVVGSIMRNCLWDKLPDCNAKELLKLEQGLSSHQLDSERLLTEVMIERALSIVCMVDCPSEICALLKLFENLRNHFESGYGDFQQIQFNVLLQSAVMKASNFKVKEICSLVCTMARLELPLTQDLEIGIKKRSIAISAEFQNQDIVELFWGFAKHRGKFANHRVTVDRQLETSLKETFILRAERFSSSQLKTMEWAFAKLNIETWPEIIRNQDGKECLSSPSISDGKMFGKLSSGDVSNFLDCFKQESSIKQISHSSLSRLHCQALLHLHEFFMKGSVDDDSMDFAVTHITGRNCGFKAVLANLPQALRKENWVPGVVLGSGNSGAVTKVANEQGIIRVLKLRYRIFVDRLRLQSVRKLQKQLKDEALHFIEIQSVHLPQFLTYKLCTDEDLVWMLVQHVNGENLDHIVKRQGTFSQTDAVEAGVSILSGLEKIHQHVFWVEDSAVQLTHGDVRPCNVVYRKDQNLYVLVDCSFSLLEYADECVRPKRFPYSSPQLFEGCQASTSDDLWSVGVLLYMLVSGKFPFEALPPYGVRDWIHAIEDADAASGLLNTVNSDPSHTNFRRLTPAFEDAVLQALSKDIDHRFPDARAMIKGLPTERKPNKECFERLMSTLARSCLCRLWLDCWKMLNSEDWKETEECVKCCMMRPEIQKCNHHSYLLIKKSQGRVNDWDITALTQLLRTIYLHEYKTIKIRERLLPHEKYLLRDENGTVCKVKCNDTSWSFVDDGVKNAEWKYRFEQIGFERNFLRHHSEVQDIPEDVFWTHWEAVRRLLVDLGEDEASIAEGCRRILERDP
jgi:serine/threonine protein kinase